MSCKYQPLFSRVIIQRELREKTAGGIIIPDAKRHARLEGIVNAVGPGVDAVKPGDRVMFGRHAGTWLDASYTGKEDNDDGTLFICQDEDILAIVGE